MTQPKQNPIRINLRGLKPITARPVLPQYSELEQVCLKSWMYDREGGDIGLLFQSFIEMISS